MAGEECLSATVSDRRGCLRSGAAAEGTEEDALDTEVAVIAVVAVVTEVKEEAEAGECS